MDSALRPPLFHTGWPRKCPQFTTPCPLVLVEAVCSLCESVLSYFYISPGAGTSTHLFGHPSPIKCTMFYRDPVSLHLHNSYVGLLFHAVLARATGAPSSNGVISHKRDTLFLQRNPASRNTKGKCVR